MVQCFYRSLFDHVSIIYVLFFDKLCCHFKPRGGCVGHMQIKSDQMELKNDQMHFNTNSVLTHDFYYVIVILGSPLTHLLCQRFTVSK